MTEPAPVHGSPHSEGVTCHVCKTQPARHKVGEEDTSYRHNYTAYLCCDCFVRVMGVVAARECFAANADQEPR